MCDTCPAHIPGPGEVAGGALGLAVGAAMTKGGRRVMFFGLALPMFLGIIVYTLGWWLVPIALGALALAAGTLMAVRRLTRHAVMARPEPTPQMRAALAARGLRPVPAPGQAARPALPRAMVRSLTRKRQALPAPARALPGVVTGKVVPAPVRKVVR
jgi:hypothetical protein